MKILENNEKKIVCEMDHDDILIMKSCLVEVCYGVKIHSFETRIGYKKDRVGNLIKELNKIINNAEICE